MKTARLLAEANSQKFTVVFAAVWLLSLKSPQATHLTESGKKRGR